MFSTYAHMFRQHDLCPVLFQGGDIIVKKVDKPILMLLQLVVREPDGNNKLYGISSICSEKMGQGRVIKYREE